MAVSTQNVPSSSLFIITTDLDNTAAHYYAINASAAMVAMFYLSVGSEIGSYNKLTQWQKLAPGTTASM